MSDTVSVTITREDKFRFTVDFGEAIAPLVTDEAPPLGEGAGPAPTHMLLAAVANCLSASLLFACGKFKQDPGRIQTTATCTIGRNDRNRLRVTGIEASIRLGRPGAQLEHLDRILPQFEDFCTVSQSVQTGIPFTVRVQDSDGATLK